MIKKSISLGVFGAGNMGMAIANGAVAHGIFSAGDVGIFDVDEGKRAAAAALGYVPFESAEELYKESRMVLLAVKPQNFDKLLPELASAGGEPPLVITIAAGISTSYIAGILGNNTKIVRVMPNTPLLIGKGASALCRTESVSDAEFEEVVAIFAALVITAVLDEGQMNEIIAVNGSSPAYVYYFIDAVAKSAASSGIDYETALKLAAQTFLGAASLLMDSDMSPDELIRMVCSPGGTTIEAIKVFDEEGVYDIIDKACKSCTRRAGEIGR